jgi:hypothetical protein
MAIVDRKKTTFWPFLLVILFIDGLGHIKNDAYSVFIVISLNTLMRIGGVACD